MGRLRCLRSVSVFALRRYAPVHHGGALAYRQHRVLRCALRAPALSAGLDGEKRREDEGYASGFRLGAVFRPIRLFHDHCAHQRRHRHRAADAWHRVRDAGHLRHRPPVAEGRRRCRPCMRPCRYRPHRHAGRPFHHHTAATRTLLGPAQRRIGGSVRDDPAPRRPVRSLRKLRRYRSGDARHLCGVGPCFRRATCDRRGSSRSRRRDGLAWLDRARWRACRFGHVRVVRPVFARRGGGWIGHGQPARRPWRRT